MWINREERMKKQISPNIWFAASESKPCSKEKQRNMSGLEEMLQKKRRKYHGEEALKIPPLTFQNEVKFGKTPQLSRSIDNSVTSNIFPPERELKLELEKKSKKIRN